MPVPGTSRQNRPTCELSAIEVIADVKSDFQDFRDLGPLDPR